MSNHKFYCPECGCNTAVARHTNVLVETKVYGYSEGYVDYGEDDTYFDDSEFEGFFCYDCGFKIPAKDDEEFVRLLEEVNER